MEKKSVVEEMGDYSFLKLLLSLMIVNNYNRIINKDWLERTLYDFSFERKYRIFFKNLVIKELPDLCYVDLSNAFLTAYRFGYISIVEDKGKDLKCLIKMNENDAHTNLKKYDDNEISTMNELLLQLKELEEPEYRVYTTGYLMPTANKLSRERKKAYIL